MHLPELLLQLLLVTSEQMICEAQLLTQQILRKDSRLQWNSRALEKAEHPDLTPHGVVPHHRIHAAAFAAGLERSPVRNAAQHHPAPNLGTF